MYIYIGTQCMSTSIDNNHTNYRRYYCQYPVVIQDIGYKCIRMCISHEYSHWPSHSGTIS